MIIETPYKHPITGHPLVISTGIGGDEGPWMTFERRPSGNLRRLVSPMLPQRATPLDARADLDGWMARRALLMQ